MKDISVTLSQNISEIRVLLLGDVHMGSPQFNQKMFDETLEMIRTHDDLYVILMGDLIENAIIGSKGEVYKSKSPQECMEWIVNKLKPIKHKILACTRGNHEERSDLAVGMDLTWWMAKCLDIEDRYSPGPFILYLSMGKSQGRTGMYHTFTFYGSHGTGMGSSTQGAAKKLQDLGNVVVNADIYIMGHTHKPMLFPEPRIVIDSVHKKHTMIEPLFVNGTSFLDFEGSYGEKMGLRPTSKRMSFIKLKAGYERKETGLELM